MRHYMGRAGQLGFLILALQGPKAMAGDDWPTGSISTPDRPAKPAHIVLAPLPETTVTIPHTQAASQRIELQYNHATQSAAISADLPTASLGQKAVPAPVSQPSAQPVAVDPAAPPAPDAKDAPGAQANVPLAPDATAEVKAALDNLPQALPLRARPLRATNALNGQQQSLQAIYSQNGFVPLWRDHDNWSAAALSLVARLHKANRDGLDIWQTPVPDLSPARNPESGATLAFKDIALTRAIMNYGWQAAGGRVNPRRISNFILRETKPPAYGELVASLRAAGGQAGDTLRQLNPQSHGYVALRAKFDALLPASTLVSQTNTPLVTPVSILDGDHPHDPLAMTAQEKRSSRQVAALGHTPWNDYAATKATLQANMEFWRWMPRDLGAQRIEVNIPEFMVRLQQDGIVTDESRVVVGKPKTPTPLFSNAVQYIIINPYWIVPQSIIRKEFLPKLAQNPNYLAQEGFEVREVGDHLDVRQPPGPHNALGHIKFIFPNNESVYLHDTSSRGLFTSRVRAFSHGCVRLSNPFLMAEKILAKGYTQQRLQAMVGKKQHFLRPPAPVQIHLEYFTARVDSQGQLQISNDIYGFERSVKGALRPYT
ncbi:MAG: L,D-transpeptidase family protein [Hyphomicrobiales bacterium]|nr:L,D-transpeptidase family protein [Hyphomicrobiales bacterium]MDE2115356.1 L,D-transpeptidase family protein [Hyphomicrobiales bacterium]